MFGIQTGAVNLSGIHQSTIRDYLAQLHYPWWLRFGYRLLSARCVFCDAAGDLGDLDLCATCLQALPWSPMGPMAPMVPMGDGVAALFEYRPPVSTALVALKFQADFRFAAVLGTLLGVYWRLAESDGPAPPAHARIVPVPLHADRLRERGFNQVALLARYASYASQWPLEHGWLRRSRNTIPQTRLDGLARRKNLQEAFEAPARARAVWPLAQRVRCLLLDDVVTTGATLHAAADALQACEHDVQRWAVARAMPTNITKPMV